MRRSLQLLLAVGLALSVGACADAWARGVANDVANGLDKINSYRGTTIEVGLGDQPVVRRVTYQKPGLVRVETIEPADHAGELFLYDGSQVIMWWPQALFGIRIRGVHLPERRAVFEHIERLTRDSLHAYTFALQGDNEHVAGHSTLVWLVRPARRAPNRMTHTVWNDDRTTLPLEMTFDDEHHVPWYHFEFKDLVYDEPLGPDTFAFELPENAVVFDWDLDSPGVTLAEARRKMNFEVLLPTPPPGHEIKKIVKSSATLPMIIITMDRGASMLSLTESRFVNIQTAPPLGKAVTIGGQPGVLAFLGAFSTITWVKNGTLLTLTGNLGFPEMLAIAETVR